MKQIIPNMKKTIEEKELEQEDRKKRLVELENEKSNSKFRFLHPSKMIKENKEIKTLKKQIKAYEEKKKKAYLLISILVMFVSMFTFIGYMASQENEANNSLNSSNIVDNNDNIDDSNIQNNDLTLNDNSTNIIISDNVDNLIEDENNSNNVDSNDAINDETNSNLLTIEDITCEYKRDFAHIFESINLGNEEGLTINLYINKPNITLDQLMIEYDKDILKMKVKEIKSDSSTTTISLYVTGIKTGESDFLIATKDDLEFYGEDAQCYIIHINKLNSTEGRLIYVTREGEKYHFSSKCAGENAIGITCYEAIAYEYEPCGNCAE